MPRHRGWRCAPHGPSVDPLRVGELGPAKARRAGRRWRSCWIEAEARKLDDTDFIVNGRIKPHAVRRQPITGQQRYSGTAAAP